MIFIEMSIDTPFRLWHQRVECHIFCRWDWAAARGLVANTIEECKHTEGHERPINASSLGLINYLKKETEVWGHQRNLIRTRFITQSLYPHSLPLAVFSFLCPSPFTDLSMSCERVNDLLTSCRGQKRQNELMLTLIDISVGQRVHISNKTPFELTYLNGNNTHRVPQRTKQ